MKASHPSDYLRISSTELEAVPEAQYRQFNIYSVSPERLMTCPRKLSTVHLLHWQRPVVLLFPPGRSIGISANQWKEK